MSCTSIRPSRAALAFLLGRFAGPDVRPAPHDPTAAWVEAPGARFAVELMERLGRSLPGASAVPAEDWEALLRALRAAARMRRPLPADGWDFDLLRAVPGSAEALGEEGDRQLHVYAGERDGRPTSLASWHDGDAFASFASLDAGHPPAPPSYVTRDRVVPVSFEELWRLAWSGGQDVWCFGRALVPGGSFLAGHMTVMYVIRGWPGHGLRDAVRVERSALRAMRSSARLLRWLSGAWERRPEGGPGRAPAAAWEPGRAPACGLCGRDVAPQGEAVYFWRCSRCWRVGCGSCVVAGDEKHCACPRPLPLRARGAARPEGTHGQDPDAAPDFDDDIPF